jgi:hypothetical protein
MPSAPLSRVVAAARRALLAGRAAADRHPLLAMALVGLAGAAVYAVARAGGGRWLIDDAAITYAFARNLAEHGSLAAYPGGTPVEGYSNPLMFFLVAGLQAAGLFHPLHTHLRIELFELGVLTALVFREAYWMAARSWGPALLGAVAFLALELSTPGCMVWYSSGLETLQASLALAVLVRFVRRAGQGRLHVAADGALAGLAALVRPEAPAYLLAAFIAARLALGAAPPEQRQARRRVLVRAAAVAIAVGGAYLTYRLIAFGFVLPNTYYAKTLAGVTRLSRLSYLPEVLRARGMIVVLLAGLVGLARTRPRSTWVPLAVMALASLAMPLHHGPDWMGEHRFAIPFFFTVHLLFALAISAALSTPALSSRLRRAVALGTAALVCLAVPLGRGGPAFMRRPHVTAEDVAIEQGFRRLEIQRRLGLLWPVVGLPDVGGSLLVGGMQLLDTGWLADVQMSRIQTDERLTHLYETHERRLDLAEDHAWSFDRAELGRTYLDIYRSPDPAWEGTHPLDTVTYAAAARNLFDRSLETGASLRAGSGLLLDGSRRSIPLAVPGALVRIEVLVQQPTGRPAVDETIRVSLAGSTDELPAFAVVPEGAIPVRPPPGRSLRQGFLVRAPRETGRFPVTVTVGEGSGAPTRGTLGELEVVEPSLYAYRASVHYQGLEWATVEQRAFALAWLREQGRARLSNQERGRLIAEFRRASRARSGAEDAPFEALLADAEREREDVPGLRPVEEWLQAEICRDLAALGSGAHPLEGGPALKVAREFDDVRRTGVTRLPDCRGARDALAALRAASVEPGEPRRAYDFTLAASLLDPSDVSLQKRLLALRPRVEAALAREERGP